MKTGWKMRKISALLLVVILALSALLSACGGKEDEIPSPSPTSTPSPTATASPMPALIKNGNFEEAYDTSYPKTPKSWSIYGDSFDGKTAPLSYKDKENNKDLGVKRGIISVEEDLFEDNKSKYGDIANPGKLEDASPDDDNIIMIYNEFPTAAKYKSSSISLPAGSFGKLTVYVKTLDDIKPSDPDHPENYEYYGATIALSGMEEPIIIAGKIRVLRRGLPLHVQDHVRRAGAWDRLPFRQQGIHAGACLLRRRVHGLHQQSGI